MVCTIFNMYIYIYTIYRLPIHSSNYFPYQKLCKLSHTLVVTYVDPRLHPTKWVDSHILSSYFEQKKHICVGLKGLNHNVSYPKKKQIPLVI